MDQTKAVRDSRAEENLARAGRIALVALAGTIVLIKLLQWSTNSSMSATPSESAATDQSAR